MSDALPTKESGELRERATEIAASTATTELWCESAQTVIYDLRDALDVSTEALSQIADPSYAGNYSAENVVD